MVFPYDIKKETTQQHRQLHETTEQIVAQFQVCLQVVQLIEKRKTTYDY